MQVWAESTGKIGSSIMVESEHLLPDIYTPLSYLAYPTLAFSSRLLRHTFSYLHPSLLYIKAPRLIPGT
jgi:hypothetical protein